MPKKRGRPREEKRREVDIRTRLRLDDDPLLTQFVDKILPQKGSISDVVREALRLYVRYHNGELEVDEPVQSTFADSEETEQINVEDIFGF